MCPIMDGPPVNVEEYQAHARRILPKMVYDYYAGGAETEWCAAGGAAVQGCAATRVRVYES